MPLQVTCAIIIDGSHVLCALRGPAMSLSGQWEFPGGKIEAGETAEQCIVREIQEELNLDVEILARGPSTSYPYQPGALLELIPFVCCPIGGALLLREHAQARWCLPAEMEELAWAKADLEILAWWREMAAAMQAKVKS